MLTAMRLGSSSFVLAAAAALSMRQRVIRGATGVAGLGKECLSTEISGKAILAPLTRGGTPPFRALCTEYGADVTMGEMSFARFLLRGDRQEVARMRRHPSESLFGVQIATKTIDEGVKAASLARDFGADWVDLNCGCPIYEATRRGLGSSLLRKPSKLARLVQGMVDGSPLPVSVKIRLSPAGDDDVNYETLVAALAGLGQSKPAFISVHGRTANSRYRSPANWTAIEQAARIDASLPVVGNGDILTHYEARDRRSAAPSVRAVMIGRGALISPWVFEEIRTQQTWLPTAEERAAVYWRCACLFKAHFGDDERGRRAANYFWPWHFDFFHRWRPLPEEHFLDLASHRPLVQSSREVDQILCEVVEGPLDTLDPLEQLLRCPVKEAHRLIADTLWAASSSASAIQALRVLASPNNLAEWRTEAVAFAVDHNT